jgi:membrane protein YqaA with SNARE-associated domain
MSEHQNGTPWEWHIIETFKGLINLSIEALKALLLINGGAAVAILAYLGNLASHPPVAHLPNMKNALLCFAGGVLVTAVTFWIAYFTQLRLYDEERARHEGDLFKTRHTIGIGIAAVLIVVSALAFAAGCWTAASAF